MQRAAPRALSCQQAAQRPSTAACQLQSAAQRSCAALAAAIVLLASAPAQAGLSAPNTRLPSSGTVALRRALPVVNADTGRAVRSVEDVQQLLRIPQRKPWGSMGRGVADAAALVSAEGGSMLLSVPEERRPAGLALLQAAESRLAALAAAVDAQDADATARRSTAVLATLAELETLQCSGLPFSVPRSYASMPRLVGRATVELEIARASSEPLATLRIVLDGYSAPLTAGNFTALVARGYYDGTPLAGDARDEVLLAVPARPSPLAATLPLEVRAQDAYEPQWRAPLDVFGGGELPVLPLSVYGAVAAARGPSAAESSGSGLFFYRYSRANAGLGGLSFEEGAFSVFGYVDGEDGLQLLRSLHSGDTIKRARVVEGIENLVTAVA